MPPSERPSVTRSTVALVLVLALLAMATTGCLEDDEPQVDLSGYRLSMTVERFDGNGLRAVNVTELLFEVTLGPLHMDTWYIQQSDGFVKGEDDTIPLSIQARYDDGKNPVEDFPIMGDDHIVTGGVLVRDGKLTVELNGDEGLYQVDHSTVRYPGEREVTVTITGTYGDLVLYFNLLPPA
jgi:hypothetical protein